MRMPAFSCAPSCNSVLLSLFVAVLFVSLPRHGCSFAPLPVATRQATTTTSNRPYPPSTTTTTATAAASSSSALFAVAKTGGRVIRTTDEFVADVVGSTEALTMVFFTAPWCGPCRLSVPVVKEVMKEYTGRMQVVEVCTDDLPEVASDAGVVSIPTIQMYSDGMVLDTIVGCVAKSVLASCVDKVLEDIEQQRGSN